MSVYLDKLKLKASQMQKPDLVKVPPILVKLRQKKLRTSLSVTSQFPSIDLLLERLTSKAIEAKEFNISNSSLFNMEQAGNLLSKLKAIDMRTRRSNRR